MSNVNLNNEAQVETVAVATATSKMKKAAIYVGIGMVAGAVGYHLYKVCKKVKTVVDVVAEEEPAATEEVPAA